MTTRRTRFDDKTIIENYNNYKDFLVFDRKMFPYHVSIITLFVGFVIMFPLGMIASLLISGNTFTLSNYWSILLTPLVSLLELIPATLPIAKAIFWKKQFKKLEEERRKEWENARRH